MGATAKPPPLLSGTPLARARTVVLPEAGGAPQESPPVIVEQRTPEIYPSSRSRAKTDSGPPDPRLERYALACAAVSVSARVLMSAHAAADKPGAVLDCPDLHLVVALAQARSAAGAMSIFGGKLIAECRDDAATMSPAVGRPTRPEPGITTAGAEDRIAMIRALASGWTEASAASISLAACSAPNDLKVAVTELLDLAKRAVEFLGD